MTSDIIPVQVHAARGLISWTQDDLARAGWVGLSTVKDFDAGRRPPVQNNLTATRVAMEAAGVEFIPENGGVVGVRLRKESGLEGPDPSPRGIFQTRVHTTPRRFKDRQK